MEWASCVSSVRESFEERMVRLRPTERLPQDPEVEAAKPRLEPVGVRARQAPFDHHEPGLSSGLNISLIEKFNPLLNPRAHSP